MSDYYCDECGRHLEWGTCVHWGAEITFCPVCTPETVTDPTSGVALHKLGEQREEQRTGVNSSDADEDLVGQRRQRGRTDGDLDVDENVVNASTNDERNGEGDGS